MKKHLPHLIASLYLLFIVSVCEAQPVLTAAGINSVIGDHYTVMACPYMAAGSAGANQTWDLSGLSADSTIHYSVVSVASTPNASSYPLATVSATDGVSYTYYKQNSSVWQNDGQVAPNGTKFLYTDMEDLLHYPFTYNNTYTDPWHCNFTSNSYPYSRSGSTTVTADGYGTLKTPAGTFNNATRIHFVQTYTDSVNFGVWYVINYQNDEYLWFINGNHYPIASSFVLTSSVGTFQSSSYQANPNGVNELADVLTSFTVFPNPAADHVNLAVNLHGSQHVYIKLFNSFGAEVDAPLQQEGFRGDNNYEIDVQHLPQGIYFAQVMFDGMLTSTRQFVVSR